MLDTSIKFLGGNSGSTKTCQETLEITSHLQRFLLPTHQLLMDLKSRFVEQLLDADADSAELLEKGTELCTDLAKIAMLVAPGKSKLRGKRKIIVQRNVR